MEPIYKRLMKQHGGSVPFPLIIRAQKKLGRGTKGKKHKTKHKTKRRLRYKQLGGKPRITQAQSYATTVSYMN